MVQGSIPKYMTQNIGDADLSYLLYEGDGPVIMLMHGAGLFPWLWHPIARELAPRWRVIAPYFCDHREETDPTKGGLSWLIIAEDLARFCERLDLDRPGLVGHSMGGNVITLAHAEFGLKARGLLLFEPIFFPQELYKIEITVEQNPLALRAMKRRSHWDSRDELQEYVHSRPLFKSWDPEILELYTNYGMKESEGGVLLLTCPKQREASMFMGGMKDDPWPLLAKVTCPTLIVEGEESENRTLIDLKMASSAIPQATHRMISHEGHLLPLENPKLTLKIIEEFFAPL
jgi:pimeloyl-ACP methyl ester carboxylesterase